MYGISLSCFALFYNRPSRRQVTTSVPVNRAAHVPGIPAVSRFPGCVTTNPGKHFRRRIAIRPGNKGNRRWFEDFGEGTITAGKAEVTLDPDFAAVVDTAKLHVFITGHDAHHLHVPQRMATGFAVAVDADGLAVRGIKATDVNSTFTYRVVAKRKDVAAPRLAKFAVPQEIKVPALVIPPTPAQTAKPASAPVVVVPPMPPMPLMPLMPPTPPMPPMPPLPPNIGKGGGQKG